MSKVRAKEPSKGAMLRFVATDEDQALVKLLTANGYAQRLVCKYISHRRGSHISESTLKRAFARGLEIGKVELETIALTQFMAASGEGAGRSVSTWIQRMAA